MEDLFEGLVEQDDDKGGLFDDLFHAEPPKRQPVPASAIIHPGLGSSVALPDLSPRRDAATGPQLPSIHAAPSVPKKSIGDLSRSIKKGASALGRSVKEDAAALMRVTQSGSAGTGAPYHAEVAGPLQKTPTRPGDMGKAVRAASAMAFPVFTAAETLGAGALNASAGESDALAKGYEEGTFPAVLRAAHLDDNMKRFEEAHPKTGLAADVIGPVLTGHPSAVAANRAANALTGGGRFFSRLERAIESVPQERALGAQWKGMLDNAKGGTWKSEREWTGVDDFLKEHADKPLTRDEVLSAAKQKAIRIGETITPSKSVDRYAGRTYETFTEPGGKNYREIKLQLERPLKDRSAGLVARQQDGYWEVSDADGGFVSNIFNSDARTAEDAVAEARRRLAVDDGGGNGGARRTAPSPHTYRSPHFNEPDIVAHLRVNDRTLPNGERVLFAEELQSDWAQRGRREGFAVIGRKPTPQDAQAYFGISDADWAKNPDLHQRWFDDMVEHMEKGPRAERPVPDMPFKKTDEWTGLAMKRLIDEAVKGGYDRVAWTPGELQAKRYGLAKDVSDIVVIPNEHGTRAVRIKPAGDKHPIKLMVDNDGRVSDGFGMYGQQFRGRHLSEVVGKDVSDRIMAASSQASISGDGLKVGGEGMRAYYDNIVPKWLQQYAKKLGVKLDIEPVPLFAKKHDFELPPRLRELDHVSTTRDLTPAEAAEYDKLYEETQGHAPSFRVTPELKAAVGGGQSLGLAHPVVTSALAAGSVGAAAGGTQGDTPMEHVKNAGLGLMAGVGLAAGGTAAARSIVKHGEAAADDLAGLTDDEISRVLSHPPPEKPPIPPFPPITPGAPLPPSDADQFVNVKKFNLSPDGEARLRQKVSEVVQDHGLAPKQRIGWQETRAQAQEIAKSLGLDAKEIDPKAGRLDGATMLAMRDVIAENMDAIDHISRQLASGAAEDGTRLSVEEVAHLSHQVNKLDDDNSRLLDSFIRSRTQTGRDLNNLKILANRTLDPVSWTSRASQLAGGDLTGEQKAAIRKFINEGDRKELVQYVAGLRKSGIGEKLVTLWKAGLLTSPTTHIANLLGNTTMAALETAKDVPAYAFDRLLTAATKTSTKAAPSLGSLRRQVAGGVQGIGEMADLMGVRDASNALREGEGFRGAASRMGDRIRKADLSEADLRKLDYRQTNFDNAFADIYTKSVFKSLGAEDRIFKNIAFNRSIDEQARLLAKVEGLKGQPFAQRVAEYTKAPSDEMTMKAIAEAEFATFQNNGRFARSLAGLKRPLGAAGEVLVPFARTPANIAERVIDYSPIGYLKSAHDVQKLLRKAVTGAAATEAQKRAAENFGRATIGSGPMGAIAAGYWLAKQGKMTGDYPEDAGARGQWELTGKQENSVNINGKWHSLERISPLGNLMVVGAQMYDILRDKDTSPTDKTGSAAATIGTSVLEMSPLQGVEGFTNALKDPKREGGRFVEGLAGSVVPSIVGRAARIGDDKVRETNGITEKLASRIPGLRERLPAKVDAFGQEMPADPRAFSALLDPTNARADRGTSDPVRAAIAENDVGITRLAKRPGESLEAYRARQRAEGDYVRRRVSEVVQSREYQDAGTWAATQLRNSPDRLAGWNAADLAAWRRQQLLQDVVRDARSDYSRAMKER